MKKTTIVTLMLAALSLTGVANAKPTFAQAHPRRAEVLHRDNAQNHRTNNLQNKGAINAHQANQLHRADNKVRAQEQADAHRNGGYITKSEQQGLNREENRVNKQTRGDLNRNAHPGQAAAWAKAHPARAEVLNRDNRQAGRVDSAQATGKINAAQSNRLLGEDKAIHNQEQRDARQNGGHITGQEQKQLNKEENRVNGQMRADERRDGSTP